MGNHISKHQLGPGTAGWGDQLGTLTWDQASRTGDQDKGAGPTCRGWDHGSASQAAGVAK